MRVKTDVQFSYLVLTADSFPFPGTRLPVSHDMPVDRLPPSAVLA